MTTEKINIFHCVACGRIERLDTGKAAPQCCGEAMVEACSENAPNEQRSADEDIEDPNDAPNGFLSSMDSRQSRQR